MEVLTQEEKELLVQQRMEIMKRKNEEIRLKQARIEAERQEMGDSAAPPKLVSSHYTMPEYRDNWSARENESNEYTAVAGGGDWPGDSSNSRVQHRERGCDDDRGVHKGGRGRDNRRGRGRGIHSHSSQHPGDDQKSPEEESWNDSPERPKSSNHARGSSHAQRGHNRSDGSNRGQEVNRGHRGRPANRGGFGNYEDTRKKNALAFEQELEGGVPSEHKFLSDVSRENTANSARTNQELRGNRGDGQFRRHPRNYYGGSDVVDLREKIKQNMTGKERLERERWRQEREAADLARVSRAQNNEGEWRRPWDREKPRDRSEPPDELHIYKTIDSKKFTKKVGSGRFVIDISTKSQPTPSASTEMPVMKGVDSIQGTPAGRGRGRGVKSKKDEDRKISLVDAGAGVKVTVPNIHTATHTKPEYGRGERSPHHPEKTPPTSPTKQSRGHSSVNHSTQQNDNRRQRNDRRAQKPRLSSSGGQDDTDNHQAADAKVDRRRLMQKSPPRKPARGQQNEKASSATSTHPNKHASKTNSPSKQTREKNIQNSNATAEETEAQNSEATDEQTTVESADTPSNMGSDDRLRNKRESDDGDDGEEDEDGWVDCSTDEEFYEEHEEDDKTPHVSKEPTPARSDKAVSKESTPVPEGVKPTAASESLNTKTENTTHDATTDDLSESSETQPAKPHLHIDIRDPVDHDKENVEDVLKTPEGGRQHIDWAAEMEDMSPISTPAIEEGNQ